MRGVHGPDTSAIRDERASRRLGGDFGMHVRVANETAGGVATLLRMTRWPVATEIERRADDMIDRGSRDLVWIGHEAAMERRVLLFAPEISLRQESVRMAISFSVPS